MRHTTWLYWLAIIGVLLTPMQFIQAKGPPGKVVVSGPGLPGEITVADEQVLVPLALGVFEDFQHGPIQAPQDRSILDRRYTVVRYVKQAEDAYWAFDRLYYYPNAGGQGGLVFYEGLAISGGQSDYDGQWFYATPRGDAAMRQLLRAQGVPGSVAQALPATADAGPSLRWLVAGCVLVLSGAGLRIRRRVDQHAAYSRSAGLLQ